MAWDSITQGAAISALGSLAGGLIGGQDGSNMDKYGMTHSIRFRVRDAKAAGIHPLYALGAPTMSPAVIQGQNNMGSAIADAAHAIGRGVAAPRPPKPGAPVKGSVEESVIMANMASAMRDEAAAIKTNSDRALNVQAANIAQDNPLERVGPDQVLTIPVTKPSTQKGQPSVAAGTQPFFSQYDMGNFFGKERTLYGPRSDEPAEAFENIGGIVASLPKNVVHMLRGITDPYTRLIVRMWDKMQREKRKGWNYPYNR